VRELRRFLGAGRVLAHRATVSAPAAVEEVEVAVPLTRDALEVVSEIAKELAAAAAQSTAHRARRVKEEWQRRDLDSGRVGRKGNAASYVTAQHYGGVEKNMTVGCRSAPWRTGRKLEAWEILRGRPEVAKLISRTLRPSLSFLVVVPLCVTLTLCEKPSMNHSSVVVDCGVSPGSE
jgi:hypothetical protein